MPMNRGVRLGVLAVSLAFAGWPAARTISRWFSMRLPEILGLDYARYYASALMGLRFGWNHLYDPEAQRTVAHELGDIFWLPNVYTPAMSLLVTPFTLLPLHTGFILWSALQLLSLLLCWHLTAPGDPPVRAVLLAMVFVPYPVTLGLLHGQVLPLQMALVAASYALARRERDFLAGVLLSCMALKPQGLQLIPFALLLAGRRRAFAGWAVAMAAMGGVVLAVIGLDGARAYLERLSWASAHPQALWVAWSYTFARHFDSFAARAVALSAAVLLSLIAAFRNRERIEVAYAAGLVGSILASPYTHLYDFMLLFPAAWLTLRVAPTVWAAPPLLAAYLFMLLSNHEGRGPRWVLLCECIWVCALALVPPAWLMRPALPSRLRQVLPSQ